MNKIFFFFFGHMYVHFDFIVLAYPSPTASMWEMINDGRNSFRKSAERMPPFFMTLVFLMLREVRRLGRFSRNSLQSSTFIFQWCE